VSRGVTLGFFALLASSLAFFAVKALDRKARKGLAKFAKKIRTLPVFDSAEVLR
jgi:hypothetical protein